MIIPPKPSIYQGHSNAMTIPGSNLVSASAEINGHCSFLSHYQAHVRSAPCVRAKARALMADSVAQ